ncbi:MAG: hypothetical protein R3324_00985 [Halobacteriales archaeon]|nr:hypothetical protein [Halobacteriales archaeon]
MQVTVVTTGADVDTEYGVSIGSQSGTISANATLTISGIPTGSRSVRLTDVAPNCSVSGDNPVTVAVTSGATATVSFAVECEALQDAATLIRVGIESMEEAMFAALNIDSVEQLDDISFAEAHGLFKDALALSPSNDTAAFGAAVTRIFLLEDDGDIRRLIDEWDAWLHDDVTATAPSTLVQSLVGPAVASIPDPMGLPLSLGTGTLRDVTYGSMEAIADGLFEAAELTHGPPPSIEALQTALGEVVAPALLEALQLIAEIDDVDFVFVVTEAMQGETEVDADPLELDFTEVLAMEAGLHLALAAIDVATAYVFTPNPLTAEGFVDALSPGSSFLTLQAEGDDRLADALLRLRTAGPILLEGLNVLQAETDDQTDDIIKYDPTGTGDGLTPTDIADARAVVEDVNAALSGPSTVTLREGTPEEVTFTLDVAEFFVDPIEDFRALLPTYEVFTADEAGEIVPVFRWTALNLEDWTLPDPTFSGVLPDKSTTADLFDLDLDEVFFEFSLASGYYRLIEVDGVDCYADFSSGGAGCAVGSDTYFDGSIDLDGHDAASQAYLDLWGTSPVRAFGPYFVADQTDGTYGVTLDLVVEDGSGTQLTLAGDLTDTPGYVMVDGYGRARGGSTVVITYLGSVWRFERSF